VFHQHLEKVASWVTEGREEEVLRAKDAYFEATGEVHEVDRSFEGRMAAFLEHFLFDRPLDELGETPASAYLRLQGAALLPEDREVIEAFTSSVFGAFEVKKLGTKLGLRVQDIVTKEAFEILERRELVALTKGDVLNARLLPWKGDHIFSGAFVYHPREARRAILDEAKRRRKQAAKSAEPASSAPLAAELARMALKLERYRNVAVENIYNFD
jgi:hypothetical protein